MIDINRILDKLFSLQRFGIKPGLQRTLKLSELYGNPHEKLKALHVAGTNGKGGTCSYINSILMEAGFKTGLYTSPHILKFNERMRINGRMISDKKLTELAEPLLDYAETHEATFFEITTVMAMKYFADENVDFAILETGMGGKYDSTNIIMPEISVITAIDIDHSEYLGDTIEKIAKEKAGIIKAGIPVVMAENPENVESIIEEKCRLTGSELFRTNDFVDLEKHPGIDPLKRNVITAIKAVDILKEKFNIPDEAIHRGIQNVVKNSGYHFRQEEISPDPMIIMDVGHNPQAVQALIDTIDIKYPGKKFNLLFGAMGDKDLKSILKMINKISNKIILTNAGTSRAAKPDNIRKIATGLGIDIDKVIEKPEDAFDYLYSLKEDFIVCGSFYLIGSILENSDNDFIIDFIKNNMI